jgi:hypothetical protein
MNTDNNIGDENGSTDEREDVEEEFQSNSR